MTPNTAKPVGDQTAALAPLRFQFGALAKTEATSYDQSLTPNASAQALPMLQLPTGGWERGVLLDVQCTTAGNAAATAFQLDGPWSALQEITFRDARGNTIAGPFTGWELYQANKQLGYQWNTDLAQSPVYSATTGGGATGGSFRFMLPIPIELIGRDAIGALANGASNTALRVNLTLAPSTAIYATAPTALAAVRVRAYHDIWLQPPDYALNGRRIDSVPYGNGTFHQLTVQRYNTVVGDQRIDLARKGNPIRGMVLVFRTAAGVRTATPALLGDSLVQFMYEGSDLLSLTEAGWRHRMWSRNNNPSTIDTGVLAIDWASDFDGKVGSELREQWLRSQPGSRLELRIAPTVAGLLDVITDEVVPNGDLVYAP